MTEICESCGAETSLSTTGLTHAYLGASSGCWARYGEVLAREYSDSHYFVVHPLTVDAYAVQHPGTENLKTINSINLHLASLYSYYHNYMELHELLRLKSHLSKHKHQFQWLHPSEDSGDMTINNIWATNTAEQHCKSVVQWGEIVFECWSEHHSYIKDICQAI